MKQKKKNQPSRKVGRTKGTQHLECGRTSCPTERTAPGHSGPRSAPGRSGCLCSVGQRQSSRQEVLHQAGPASTPRRAQRDPCWLFCCLPCVSRRLCHHLVAWSPLLPAAWLQGPRSCSPIISAKHPTLAGRRVPSAVLRTLLWVTRSFFSVPFFLLLNHGIQ